MNIINSDERRRRKLALQGRTSLLSSTKPRSSHTTSSTHHSTRSHPQRSVTDNVAHIELSPRPIRKTRLFSGYMQHLFYFTDEKGLIFRLLRGVVYGRPALDIQIIHGTCDIFDKRETAARAEIRSICRLIRQIKHDRQELIASSSSSGTSSTNSVYSDNDINMAMMASSERGWSSTVYWESLRRAVEGCDETDPIVCQQHSPNPDRCMYQDESIEMDSAIGASGSGESVPLLSEVASVVHDRQRRRPYPHSRPCRTYSRRMVAMLLIVLTLQAVVFLCGVGVFVYSCYIEGGRNTATTGTSTSTVISTVTSTATNSLTVATQRGLEETASSQLFAAAAASTTTSALHSESKCRNLSVQESRVLSPLYEFFEQIPTPSSSTGSSSNSGSSSSISGTYS